MENEFSNELIMPAMGMLSHSGDARLEAKKALEFVQKQNFKQARIHLKTAKKEITKAHQAQTEIIQNEARGIRYEYCMLFNHAQDTLMSINSEIELIATLIDTFEIYSKLIKEREK